MPRRTRDELIKLLCKNDQHLPRFKFLLEFVEKQLKIVSHPLMNVVSGSQKTNESKPKNNESSYYEHKMLKNVDSKIQTPVKSYTQSTTTNRCLVIGCTQHESHPLWACTNFCCSKSKRKMEYCKKAELLLQMSQSRTLPS